MRTCLFSNPIQASQSFRSYSIANGTTVLEVVLCVSERKRVSLWRNTTIILYSKGQLAFWNWRMGTPDVHTRLFESFGFATLVGEHGMVTRVKSFFLCWTLNFTHTHTHTHTRVVMCEVFCTKFTSPSVLSLSLSLYFFL
jgi:hypothetical protein